MFRSLHMKLTLILLLLVTSLMAVVGAFLTTSISSFYIDSFYQQISSVFSDGSDGYVSTLRARAGEDDGAAGLRELLEVRAGSLGIDYRRFIYYAGKQAFTTKVMMKIAHAGPSMWESVPELISFVSTSQITAEIVPKMIAMMIAIHALFVLL